MIDVEKLKKNSEKIKKMNTETYKMILAKFNNKINYLSEIGKDECWYQVPHFVLGIPPYNLTKCCDYIKKQMEKINFTSFKFYKPNIFYVSWK